MCLAIPAKIIEIKNDKAIVDYGGIIKKINIDFIENISKGDFILIHAGFAIQKINDKEAKKTIKSLKKLDDEIKKNI